MSVSRDVLLTGARAYVANIVLQDGVDPEAMACELIDLGSAVRASIVAAVEADRLTPVPWGPLDPGFIPAQREVTHADR